MAGTVPDQPPTGEPVLAAGVVVGTDLIIIIIIVIIIIIIIIK